MCGSAIHDRGCGCLSYDGMANPNDNWQLNVDNSTPFDASFRIAHCPRKMIFVFPHSKKIGPPRIPGGPMITVVITGLEFTSNANCVARLLIIVEQELVCKSTALQLIFTC